MKLGQFKYLEMDLKFRETLKDVQAAVLGERAHTGTHTPFLPGLSLERAATSGSRESACGRLAEGLEKQPAPSF